MLPDIKVNLLRIGILAGNGAIATALADLKRYRASRLRGEGLPFDWILFFENVAIGALTGVLLGGGADVGEAALS